MNFLQQSMKKNKNIRTFFRGKILHSRLQAEDRTKLIHSHLNVLLLKLNSSRDYY